MKEKKANERRRHARFKVKSGGLALLPSAWPTSTVVGDILDISTGGLALRYTGEEPNLKKLGEIGIASTDPPFFLEKLPVKSIADFSMTKVPFGKMIPRRLSLKFGSLSQDQASHLKEYIKDHALTSV